MVFSSIQMHSCELNCVTTQCSAPLSAVLGVHTAQMIQHAHGPKPLPGCSSNSTIFRASDVKFPAGLPAITTSGRGSTAASVDGNLSRSATLYWALVNPFATAFACAAWKQNLTGVSQAAVRPDLEGNRATTRHGCRFGSRLGT